MCLPRRSTCPRGKQDFICTCELCCPVTACRYNLGDPFPPALLKFLPRVNMRCFSCPTRHRLTCRSSRFVNGRPHCIHEWLMRLSLLIFISPSFVVALVPRCVSATLGDPDSNMPFLCLAFPRGAGTAVGSMQWQRAGSSSATSLVLF